MLKLSQPDLASDPAARRVVKDEAVSVEFAAAAGELMSLEGPNRYAPGDAIVTGASGERWVVSRERFDAKYLPEGGIARSAHGDTLTGDAGDWVMQYAPGDYGVVKAARFAKVYHDA